MGGNAFQKTQSIESTLIPGVIRSIQRKLITPVNFALLGSTGKKRICGDIDLAVSHTEYSFQSFLERAQLAFGHDNVKAQPQFNQIYSRVAIPNTKGRKFCQVDFMIGSLPLLEFTNWAPHPSTSDYAGSHRTQLIKAVAKARSVTAHRNGRVVARIGYTLMSDTGLHYGARWCPPRKDGNGFTNTMVKVTDDTASEFAALFPELLYLGERTWQRPDDICEELFGCGTTEKDVNSFEDVANRIRENPSLIHHSDLIWDLYCRQLTEMDIIIPPRTI